MGAVGTTGESQGASSPSGSLEAFPCASLKIAVCDDDAAIRETLAGYCARLCAECGVGCAVTCFEDGDRLLDGFSNATDILLLDIEMPLLDGMAAARQIRRGNAGVCIVFVTSFERYAVPGYEVGAYRYLLKPLEYGRFARELRDAFERARDARSTKVCLKVKGGVLRVDPADIALVETGRNHRITALVDGQPVDLRETTMAELEALLGEVGFFRCHASYLVNLAHVRFIGPAETRLDDGRAVPVSKHRKHAFKEVVSRLACRDAFGCAWNGEG